MSKINLTDVLDNCRMRVNGLFDEEDFDKFLETIEIVKYLPLDKKRDILFLFLMDIKYLTSGDEACDDEIQIEINSLFNILLAYTNINTGGYTKLFTKENYDTIYMSGLADYILDFCERDYNKSIDMFRDSLRIDDMLSVKVFMEELEGKNIAKNLKSMKKMIEEMSANGVIDKVNDIAMFNDSIVNNIKQQLLDVTNSKK